MPRKLARKLCFWIDAMIETPAEILAHHAAKEAADSFDDHKTDIESNSDDERIAKIRRRRVMVMIMRVHRTGNRP